MQTELAFGAAIRGSLNVTLHIFFVLRYSFLTPFFSALDEKDPPLFALVFFVSPFIFVLTPFFLSAMNFSFPINRQ